MNKRPNILTIAGFDPSSGAGITADIKTFETLNCYGFSVCTANTIQNDISFLACHWTPIALIKSQIELLFDRFEIDFVKIGIVENWHTLSIIVQTLLAKNSAIKIVLDPVLRSSSAFDFHMGHIEKLDEILPHIYLITPNYIEIENLYADKNSHETIAFLSSQTNLFLKGGHRKENIGRDVLYNNNNNNQIITFEPKQTTCTEKHGSGCVLSSAITSYLALGFPLTEACEQGKRYTEHFLSSTPSLLGFHSKNIL